jgi:hypothetical protein
MVLSTAVCRCVWTASAKLIQTEVAKMWLLEQRSEWGRRWRTGRGQRCGSECREAGALSENSGYEAWKLIQGHRSCYRVRRQGERTVISMLFGEGRVWKLPQDRAWSGLCL